ncbi:hypothetical protein DSCOOX_50950 [Desulfosarcina ovata subsp. ovata]|uniref:Uncharacterized protein n=1 Tax=Desulfosarcina ovata subsp. ovata TaxID=2752305 RepID=A0A5K8AGV3_9BACT|nr:hypothetical protein DSCOOX_50950 [Desulfosarcina ovata subsp. ovata]
MNADAGAADRFGQGVLMVNHFSKYPVTLTIRDVINSEGHVGCWIAAIPGGLLDGNPGGSGCRINAGQS